MFTTIYVCVNVSGKILVALKKEIGELFISSFQDGEWALIKFSKKDGDITELDVANPIVKGNFSISRELLVKIDHAAGHFLMDGLRKINGPKAEVLTEENINELVAKVAA
jgi:hypothetical protein